MEWSGSAAYKLNVFAGSTLNLTTTSTDIVPVNYNESFTINSAIPKGIFFFKGISF